MAELSMPAMEDGVSQIVMEHQNTADYYFPVLASHWNDSVNSIIQMGIQLKQAQVMCNEAEFASLSKRLNDSGITSKKQQQNLMSIPSDTKIINYYKDCVSNGTKASLPNDWKVLHAVSLLSDADFKTGTRDGIIGPNTTIGDLNKLV